MGHPVAEQPAADAADEGQAPDGLSDGYSRFELELEVPAAHLSLHQHSTSTAPAPV